MRSAVDIGVAGHVDRELSAIAESYSVLLAVTPTNSERAYRSFSSSDFEAEPVFEYRPVDIVPVELKRRLYNIAIEEVDDPDLAYLLDEKRKEIDREITLIEELNTESFRYVSMQLYGVVEQDLLSLAEGILSGIPPPADESAGSSGFLDAHAFCSLALAEIEGYRRSYPNFNASCEVREDVDGLVVSKNKLLIGDRVRVAEDRVDAALHHEVGTHLVTYYNGKAQPLRLLATGLPNYDELQEGLAVLAEYFAGGFTRSRARTLAGRVVAVRTLCDGKDFARAFRLLHREYAFSKRVAFTMCMRVYRGGGLTKDAVYLRGLKRLLQFLGDGGAYKELFNGKFSLGHVPYLNELRQRGILSGPRLEPRYMERGRARKRIKLLGEGLSVLDLIEKKQT